MTIESTNSVRSEKGMALITVLLLLAVVSALTTALAMSGQTEVAMASNEVYYAGARAAAEAGLNRAAEHLNDVATLNLLAGADGNPNATADNGVVPTIGNGPFTLTNQYTYTLQILDDDNPVLYVNPLSAAQLGQMDEQSPTANPNVSQNNVLILRATGLGPRNTRVIVQRVINVTTIPQITNTPVQTQSNPAILVNGDLSISGSMVVGGTQGNVHANGDVSGSGASYDVRGNLTATGSFHGDVHADGVAAPNMPAVAVPEIKAADYKNLADYILTAAGAIVDRASGLPCGAPLALGCPSGWTPPSAIGQPWTASGKIPSSATYYVEGPVSVHGTGNSAMTSLSIIAEGNLTLTGNAKFRPENTSGIQFVTNGDFQLGGTTDADEDTIDMDGQILVREQMDIYGNSEFQGRVIVEDRDGASNAYNVLTNPHGRRGADAITSNTLRGNMTVTYNGGLGNITTTNIIPVAGAPEYTNNVSGWIES